MMGAKKKLHERETVTKRPRYFRGTGDIAVQEIGDELRKNGDHDPKASMSSSTVTKMKLSAARRFDSILSLLTRQT